MPVRCSLLLTMRCNPNVAQRKQLKQEDSFHLRSIKDPGYPIPTPPIPIKSFLTTLEAGSKYGLRLNGSNLKIIEHPGTLVLEMKNLDLEEIEEFLTQSLGMYFYVFILFSVALVSYRYCIYCKIPFFILLLLSISFQLLTHLFPHCHLILYFFLYLFPLPLFSSSFLYLF